ncbi:MAG: nucleotidyltransferase domain-containing protein [Armatimonadetes bacterium]|nr:nucleotidyltransferase domain-containing protein [Armatimonadota bacterium]NCP30936.1 nucleotidyltransferase domain-containing protein [Armatimonadota bacterium]NCQ32344.1 nucleotidyltransferase domain-containing protein [Armatimonadota bacterium]NDK15746.1 nucleotidyltransferase domain-containing protein [Armatimonadota bacterium]
MAEGAVLRSVREYLNAVQQEGIPVQFGVLFGSHATGRADQWSDIDLLVVSPRYDTHRTRADLNLLWRLAARTDSRVEPVPVGRHQYEDDDSSAIIETARREGQIVYM